MNNLYTILLYIIIFILIELSCKTANAPEMVRYILILLLGLSLGGKLSCNATKGQNHDKKL